MPFRTHRTTLLIAAAAAVAPSGLLSLASPASAADVVCTRYASTTGSDSAAGSSSAPYRTVQKLVSSLTSGQTGCLRTGSYAGNVTLSASGTTLRSMPGERATLRLSTLTIPAGASQVTVSDLNIVGGGGALTMRPIGNRFTITRNDITNNHAGLSCILVGAQSSKSLSGTVKGNKIHHCGVKGSTLDHGVYAQNFGPAVAGSPGLTVEDNVFFSMGAYSVQLYPNGTGAVVQRNVMDGGAPSTRGGVVIDGGTAQGHRIERNIIVGTRTGGIIQRTGSGHVARDNCFWQNGSSNVSGSSIAQSGSLTADPLFVDRAAGDYRLATSSPCRAKVGQDTAALLGTTTTTAPAPAPVTSPTSAPAPAPTASTVGTVTVSVGSPTAGSVVGNDLLATATASSTQARITKVEFLVDGRLVGTETGAPYSQWLSSAALPVGTHTFTARAFDLLGASASASVSFTKR